MTEIIAEHLQELLFHAPHERTEATELRHRENQFAHWLFATDHITEAMKSIMMA